MKTNKTTNRLVYSTEHGRMCPECAMAVSGCVCSRKALASVADGIVRVSRETKGRRGKGVTVIKGVALDPLALTQLGKQLKTTCGAGGTVKDGIIEIQGDHIELVSEYLRKQGLVVKQVGG